MEFLTDAVANDPVKLRTLISLYVEHTTYRLGEIKKAVDRESRADVQGMAHRCLGSSLTCGMEAIIPVLRKLEQAGIDGDMTAAGNLVVQAQSELDRTVNFFADRILLAVKFAHNQFEGASQLCTQF